MASYRKSAVLLEEDGFKELTVATKVACAYDRRTESPESSRQFFDAHRRDGDLGGAARRESGARRLR
jgi:hypothetical protein